jgi:preprotein translocase subunit SecG
MSILITLLLGLWVLVALLMTLVILMQRPKSEGLGAAFGGAVTENLFGAQTTNVLVKFTSWLGGIFFVITFALSILYAHRSMAGGSLSRELKKTAPAAQTAPAKASPAATAGMGMMPKASAAPTQPAATSSPAPDSGAGVVPAGTAPVSAGSAPPTRQNTPGPAQSPPKP